MIHVSLCNYIRDAALAFIYPSSCFLCGSVLSAQEGPVCSSCWEQLAVVSDDFCPRCGHPFPSRGSCPGCAGRDFFFRFNRALGPFDEGYERLIHAVKYRGKARLARNLGREMSALLIDDARYEGADFLIPVPLHSTRQRERGYNQSALLAREISRWTDVHLLSRVLKRRKRTMSQTTLGVHEREENVSDAFRVTDEQAVAGKKLVLVDDVFTTGATLNACARVLMEAGAREVCSVTAAIAVGRV